MDFSQFNGPEQAHMTKVIEKKQVSGGEGGGLESVVGVVVVAVLCRDGGDGVGRCHGPGHGNGYGHEYE